MRTLKRTMCLVLAMVMLLGLCAIQASAVDTNLGKYQDQNQITYKEAVDVLTGIDVMEGDANGFRPTDKVTRAEAAAIITRLLIGNAEAARALKADVQIFSDVPVTNWAAGYISYCYERGIIVGNGDGTFSPNDNVTGIAFGKMLLTSIGYGVKKEYEGPAWMINVAKDGVQYGIYDGNLPGASENAASREECALYAFNTLILAKVTYSELFGGYVENVGLGISQAQSNKADTIAGDYELHTSEIRGTNSSIGKNFGVDYTHAAVDDDMFYRPVGHYWYQRTPINSVSDYYGGEKFLLKSFDAPVTGADLFETLGAALVTRLHNRTLPLYIYENGLDYTTAFVPKDANREFELLRTGTQYYDTQDKDGNYSIRRGNTDIFAHTGYGVETNVYAVADHSGDIREVRITLVHTYLAQVDDVKGATGTIPAYIRVKLPVGYTTYFGGTNATFSDFDASVTGYAKGSYILFNYSFRADHPDKDPGIQNETVREATIYSNRITSYTNYTDNYRGLATIGVGGTNYYQAKDDAVMNNQTSAGNVNRSFVNGNNYNIITDGSNHIIGVDTVIARKDFVFVTEFGYLFTTAPGDMREKLTLTARAFDSEGKEEVIYVDTSTRARNDRGDIINSEFTSLNGWYNNDRIVSDPSYSWEARAMTEGERNYVARLNGGAGSVYDARGVYYRGATSDGKYILMNLEDYARYKDTGAAKAIGENESTVRNKVYRGVAGLRNVVAGRDENGRITGELFDAANFTGKAVDLNTNVHADKDVRLYADANTVFFYVGQANGRPDLSKKPTVYVGISSVKNATDSNDGSVAWYGEYSRLTDDKYRTNTSEPVYAQVVLVVDDENERVDHPPVFIYLDDNTQANKGSYTKRQEGDSFFVDFNLYAAGETVPTVKTIEYDTSALADRAIKNAEYLVNDWVYVNEKKNDGGLVDWNANSPYNKPAAVASSWEAQKKNDTDKLWYADLTRIHEIRTTNNGDTLFYQYSFTGANELEHYRGIELTGNEFILDLRRNVPEDTRITSLTELRNVAQEKTPKGTPLKDTPNYRPGDYYDIEVVLAYNTDLTVKAIYVVNVTPKNDPKRATDINTNTTIGAFIDAVQLNTVDANGNPVPTSTVEYRLIDVSGQVFNPKVTYNSATTAASKVARVMTDPATKIDFGSWVYINGEGEVEKVAVDDKSGLVYDANAGIWYMTNASVDELSTVTTTKTMKIGDDTFEIAEDVQVLDATGNYIGGVVKLKDSNLQDLVDASIEDHRVKVAFAYDLKVDAVNGDKRTIKNAIIVLGYEYVKESGKVTAVNTEAKTLTFDNGTVIHLTDATEFVDPNESGINSLTTLQSKLVNEKAEISVWASVPKGDNVANSVTIENCKVPEA